MGPQRHTPSVAYSVLQGSHIPLTRWEWLIWKIQIGIPQNEKIKSRTITSDPVYSQMKSSTWSVCQEKHLSVSPCRAILKM